MATVLHEVTIPDMQLPETDGEPLDSPWHRDEINLLVETVRCRFPDRTDYFAGGNMFIYFSLERARNQDFRGPDFFYVKGVDRYRDRRYWAVWDEGGKYPNVIVELLSASTAKEDRTTKKTVYEQTFRTPEYFLYDPDMQALEGWRLAGTRYARIEPNEKGRLWSEQLELWLGTWEGPYQGEIATWLRCFDANGQLVRLGTEDAEERAESQRRRADTERQRAETERLRADAAEAELKRLRALMPDARETDS
jgi:Uma2 family endonuclease